MLFIEGYCFLFCLKDGLGEPYDNCAFLAYIFAKILQTVFGPLQNLDKK